METRQNQGGSGTKRKRSRSKSQPSKKRKQTGGIYPPIHYPAGNYPGYDMVGRGLISKMRREMEKIVRIGTNDNRRGAVDLERSVNPKNKREQERNVNPENRLGMACGQD